MYKFRLLLLSLCVFASALYAGDKENEGGNASFFDVFKLSNSSNISKEKLSQRRASVDASQSQTTDIGVTAYRDLLEQIIKVDRFARMTGENVSNVQREMNGKISSLDKRINDQVIEKVSHDSQPAVDDLASQFQQLLEKVETHKERLQSAATKEEVEQLGKDFAAVISDLNKAVEQFPTSEEVKTAIGDLTKGFKGYFATKEEMLGLFVEKHKVDQSVVSTLKKDIATVTEQMPTRSNPQGFAREAHVDQRVHALKQKQDALVAQLADKADRSDLNGYPTKDDIQEVKALIPTAEHPQGLIVKADIEDVIRQKDLDVQGFAKQADVEKTVQVLNEQLKDKADRSDLNGYPTKDDIQEVKESIPTVENPQGFVTEEQLRKQNENLHKELEGVVREKDGNPVVRLQTLNDQFKDVAKKDDMQDFVSQKTYEETVQKLQQQITALEKNSPKEQLKSGIIYIAKQGVLGCFAYQLSPHMASLLRSLKLENSYVDLETVAVPTTTFAVSLLARLAKERYEKGKESSLQNVAKESALDAGVSAGIMGLRYICFDDQMNEYVNQASEQNRTAGYAVSYALLRSLVALFA